MNLFLFTNKLLILLSELKPLSISDIEFSIPDSLITSFNVALSETLPSNNL